jgi:hypothetical protein
VARPSSRVQHPTPTGYREASTTSPVDTSSTLPKQSGASQPPTTATDGTVSDLDKLFPQLLPSVSPAPSPDTSKLTRRPFSSLPRCPVFQSCKHTAYCHQQGFLPSLIRPCFHHTPPPGFPSPTQSPEREAVPSSTHLAFAQARQHSDIFSSEPGPPNLHLPPTILRRNRSTFRSPQRRNSRRFSHKISM